MIFMAILMCIKKKQVVPPFKMYYFTNLKLSLIWTSAGPKLLGLVRVYCTRIFVSDKSKKPKKPGVKKEDSSSSFPKIALMDPSSVRANAKRALYQILWKR